MKVLVDVYVLKGIIHVPHWLKPGLFVSPGYGRQHQLERTAADLIVKGAKLKKEWMFARAA